MINGRIAMIYLGTHEFNSEEKEVRIKHLKDWSTPYISDEHLRWISINNKSLIQLSDEVDSVISNIQGINSHHRIIFFDEIELLNCKNPSGDSKEARLCQLILTFPEVIWIPVAVDGINEMVFSEMCQDIPHGLYDALGIREYIKNLLSQSTQIPCRQRDKIGIILEEESTYAYANAYILYKNGMRVFPLTTHKQASYVLNRETLPQWNETCPAIPKISIEDWDLRLPDWQPNEGCSEPQRNDIRDLLGLRLQKYPLLDKLERWICTLNPNCLLNKEEKATFAGKIIEKPIGGFYDLEGKLFEGNRPAPESFKIDPPEDLYHHSAPGIVVLLTEIIIRRAKNILANAISPEQYLIGATLALNANELIGKKCPTLSYETHRLIHIFESKFEIDFPGSSYHNNAESRISFYEEYIRSLSNAPMANHKDKKRIETEWLISLTADIERIYRNSGDFEEAETYSFALKNYNRKLSKIDKFNAKGDHNKFTILGILDYLVTKPIPFLIVLVILVHLCGVYINIHWGELYIKIFKPCDEIHLTLKALLEVMKLFFYSIVTGVIVYRLLRR